MRIDIMSKKRKVPPTTDLDEYEQEIEESFEKVQPYSRKKVSIESLKAKNAAANFMQKNKRITIRIYSSDLERIKRLALEEGLPYQTFITSVLHKLSTGRLVNHQNTGD